MSKILIYGGSSQAYIVSKMIMDLNLGDIVLIYDPTIKKPRFKTEINFSNKLEYLLKKIEEREITDFHVCIGNHYGYARSEISEYLKKLKLNPMTIVSEKSIVDETAHIGNGVLIMPGAIIQKYSKIGNFSIINTGSIIEHEVTVGKGVHTMSGSVITGRVRLGNYSTIGSNATILPDINIAKEAIIGAGSVVTKNVPEKQILIGSPAKFVKYHKSLNPIF